MKLLKLLSLAALSCTSNAFLIPGSQAPNFTNVDALMGIDATKLSLDDYKGKNLIIMFYPGDF